MWDKKNENMAVWTIPRHCEGDVLTLTVRFMVIGLINKTQTCRRGRESSRCLSSAESSYEWMMLGLKSTYQTQRGGWKGINRDGAFLTHTHTHTHTHQQIYRGEVGWRRMCVPLWECVMYCVWLAPSPDSSERSAAGQTAVNLRPSWDPELLN